MIRQIIKILCRIRSFNYKNLLIENRSKTKKEIDIYFENYDAEETIEDGATK